MSRLPILIYALLCYAIFLAVFVYLIAFVENVPILARFGFGATVSNGIEGTAFWAAITINLGLILAFGLQHSIMARRGFKKWWTQIIPASAERSTYVLIASLVFILLFWQWRTLPITIWDIDNRFAAGVIYALSGLGWAIVLLSTFLLGHFTLFGVTQAWLNMRGASMEVPSMREPIFYKYVRHPLYSGFLLAFWATPYMTLSHAVFAAGFTAYVLIAIRYEEKDLVQQFGGQYIAYRKRVAMLIPFKTRGSQ